MARVALTIDALDANDRFAFARRITGTVDAGDVVYSGGFHPYRYDDRPPPSAAAVLARTIESQVDLFGTPLWEDVHLRSWLERRLFEQLEDGPTRDLSIDHRADALLRFHASEAPGADHARGRALALRLIGWIQSTLSRPASPNFSNHDAVAVVDHLLLLSLMAHAYGLDGETSELLAGVIDNHSTHEMLQGDTDIERQVSSAARVGLAVLTSLRDQSHPVAVADHHRDRVAQRGSNRPPGVR